MAKEQTIDELFPSGTPPEVAPTPEEIRAASSPSFYPRAGRGDGLTPSPKEQTIDDMFPTGGPPASTAGELAKQTAIGAVQGAARDAPVMAGAMTGLRLGMPLAAAAAPVMGPFAAGIPLVTTALGAGAGYLAGSELDKFFPATTAPDQVPYREGGKTFGSSIATAPAAFYLPVMTGNRVSQFISGMGEAARRSPKAFLATEAVTAGTMGLAGGAAEAYRPGQELTRFGAELAGGVLAPSKLLFTGVDAAKTGLTALKGSFTNRSSSLEKKATNLLLDALNKTGEDPAQLLKALRQQLPAGIPSPTAGQKTGNQALMDLEASLSEHRAEFGGEVKKQGETAFLAYQALVDKLQEIGNPQSLKLAADLSKQRFDNMIDTRLSLADADAAKKIARISKDTPDARKDIGQIVKIETEKALAQARDVESQVWSSALESLTKPVAGTRVNKVPMEGPDAQRIADRTGKWPQISITLPTLKAPVLKPSATAEAFLSRAANVGEALYDDAIPAPVRKIMDSLRVNKESVQRFRDGKVTQEYLETKKVPYGYMPNVSEVGVDELVNYRSTLLKMAREAAGKGDVNNANFYGNVAEGMMKDLDTLQDPAFNQARQFSKSLNDVFTRTFAKTASITGDVTAAGKERLSAEMLVNSAFGGSADQTAQRMKEIEDAVGFMRTQYRDAVAKFGKDSPQAMQLQPLARAAVDDVASVRDAHNRVLRLAASDALRTVFDPVKNAYVQKLDYNRLTKFAQQNAPLLEKMGIMGDLRDAAHASNLLTQVANQNSLLTKTANSQAAFAKLLTAESPTVVISDALNGRFPVKSINSIVDLAKKSGPEAVDGLKASLYDYAYAKAKGFSGAFSPDAYESALFNPLGRNQPSLVNIMRSNGLLTLPEVSNLKKLLTPMVRIETAIKNNIPLEDVIQGADAVTELGLRVVGSKIGTTISGAAGSGGDSLIAAAAGSKAVRQIFDSLPNATVRQILENAVKDPEAMAILLQKGRTQKEQSEIGNKLLKYLGTYGVQVGKSAITPALTYIAPDEPSPLQIQKGVQAPFTPQGAAARQLRMMPPAPTTRGVPGFGPKAPGGAEKGSGPPTNANARGMYQSLFPMDTISPMVGGQQPPPPPQQ